MHRDPLMHRHRMAFFKQGAVPASVMKPVELSDRDREMMEHRIRQQVANDPARMMNMPDTSTVNQLPEPRLG